MADKVKSFQVQGKPYSVDPDLTFDGFPTEGSSNPVTSNGIYVALQGAVIGDNISYGRTTGSPVGYCSISYGKNNIAAQDYCIVFGEGNTGVTKWSIISGEGNVAHGHDNFAFGASNSIFGHYSGVLGESNICGITGFRAGPLDPTGTGNSIYVGYINLNTKKVYSDEAMQTPINIPLENRDTCYILDLTNNTNQHAGDVYEYYRNGSSYTLTYIINDAVQLNNNCNSIGYVYKGIAYYKVSNGTLYSDSGYTSTIRPIFNVGEGYKYLYFDPILREFITTTIDYFPSHPPKWMTVKVYKRGYIRDDTNKVNYVLRFGYISKSNNRYRVYTSPDFEESTEITNDLYDGEIVCDYAGGNRYMYFFDSSHNYIYAKALGDYSGVSYFSPATANVQLAVGLGNEIKAGLLAGVFTCGHDNKIYGLAEGAAVMGLNNSHYIINENGGTSFITGEFNHAFSPTGGKGFALIGGYNNIKLQYYTGYYGISGGCRYSILGGYYNRCEGISAYENILFGNYNTTSSSDNINILGTNNTVYDRTYDLINGFWNRDGDIGGGNFISGGLTQNKSGIYEGDDVSYNASTGMYTFPTNRIFKMYAWNSNGSRNEHTFVGCYISTDGHTLTSVSYRVNPCYNTIIGYTNYIYRKIDTVADINDQSQYNYILGAHNNIYARNMKAIGAIGYWLKVDYPNDNAPDGAIFLGAYNSMGETTNAQVVIGIGTSESERSNGFVVYKNGITAAPACPNTVSAASSAAAADGIDAGKVLVSYAMLQDYTSPGGGGSSRPTVTVLNLEAANWSNEEITESLPNITENSIVIIQPSGNPHAFYTDEIYLKSQGEGEVTFGCSVVPSVDITVKVVYWV